MSLTALHETALRLHAGTADFERKVEQATNVLRAFFVVCDKPYVSYSGGKDSTVLLHLARLQSPGVDAVFSDDEYNLPETMTHLDTVENLTRVAGRTRHNDWFVSWADGARGVPADTEWVECDDRALEMWAKREGYTGTLIGSRADENKRRKANLRKRGQIYQLSTGEWRCYPLAWWKDWDVWAYILSRSVAYNQAYDRMRELGVPPHAQRIGPFAAEGALRNAQLSTIKLGWPDLFNRFAARYPEARRYT